MNILLIGAGYFPFLTAGEKNFFYRLIPILNEHAEVTVASLNDFPKPLITQETKQYTTQVYCLKRPFHRNYERFFFEKSNYIAYHHRHKPIREIIEKLLSVIIHTPKLRNIINKHNIQVVHFMDNFGPSMPYVKRLFRNVKVTYSAANYDPRGRKEQYDQYLRISLGSLDAAGVYTEAYRDVLNGLGINIPLHLTKWGVSPVREYISQEEKHSIKKMLGIDPQGKFLLWSGYLQQIQESDFYKAVDVARKVVEQEDDLFFIFAFKPETYNDIYALEEDKNIKILTGLENFGDVLEAADFFFSPIADTNSTVSPPLTWLEAMSKGTPIITTRIHGVEELITHEKDGFIAHDYKDLPEIIQKAINHSDTKVISRNCIKKIEQDFNIEQSAKVYLEMWRSVLDDE